MNNIGAAMVGYSLAKGGGRCDAACQDYIAITITAILLVIMIAIYFIHKD